MTQHEASKERLIWLVNEMARRIKEEPDPQDIGNIVPLLGEAKEKAQELGIDDWQFEQVYFERTVEPGKTEYPDPQNKAIVKEWLMDGYDMRCHLKVSPTTLAMEGYRFREQGGGNPKTFIYEVIKQVSTGIVPVPARPGFMDFYKKEIIKSLKEWSCWLGYKVGAPQTKVDAQSIALQQGKFSAQEWAKRENIKKGPLESWLTRYRKKNPGSDSWIEDADRRKGSPRFYYKTEVLLLYQKKGKKLKVQN